MRRRYPKVENIVPDDYKVCVVSSVKLITVL